MPGPAAHLLLGLGLAPAAGGLGDEPAEVGQLVLLVRLDQLVELVVLVLGGEGKLEDCRLVAPGDGLALPQVLHGVSEHGAVDALDGHRGLRLVGEAEDLDVLGLPWDLAVGDELLQQLEVCRGGLGGAAQPALRRLGLLQQPECGEGKEKGFEDR